MKKFIKKIKSNKTLHILSILIIGVFFILAARVTFAFLAPVINSAQTDVVGTSDTVDDFKFELGDALNIDATPTTLPENGNNYVTSTTAKALLKANSTKNTATYNYYVYFEIKSNTFTYSDGTTPEIILTITDPNGDEITAIDNLTYGTFNGVSGFDVTTTEGLINIANNYEITSNSSTSYTTQEWNITLTYLNLPIDQSANYGKSMKVNVYIRKEEKKLTIADVCPGKTLKDCVIAQYTGTQGENSIYYHNGTIKSETEFTINETTDFENTYPAGTILDAADNSYRYAGGDYKLTDTAKELGATQIASDDINMTTAVIDFYCDGEKKYVGYFSSCNNSYFLIKNDATQYETYKAALNAAVEKKYLTKDNVKNFVCFGTDESPCPANNLYRIIGVFGENYHGINGQQLVKLIKYDYMTTDELGTDGDYQRESAINSKMYKGNNANITSYAWNNSTTTSAWSESLLNKTNLNTNFINYLGTKWANKIVTTKWKVGGSTATNTGYAIPSVIYQNEIVNPSINENYSAKIGLMYASDYRYAASPSAWKTCGDGDSTSLLNWTVIGLGDWLITCYAGSSNLAFHTASYGVGGIGFISVNNGYPVHAVFNLEPSVMYKSGSGTMSDPIIIN